jgi:hypothetical protein
LITAVGLLLVVAAAFYVAWPMLAPPAPPEEPSAADLPGGVAALARRRDAALAALKEAEFDHQVGKLSDADHATLRAELEVRALEAIAALDAAQAPAGAAPVARGAAQVEPKAAAPRDVVFCSACGNRNPAAARFCSACGGALHAPERPRQRA